MTVKPLTALLPMKGHSERVPNKNMRLFGGAPLFHRIACTLELCPLVTSVVIDTDSDAIARSARESFPTLRLVERPESLRGDLVSMNEIIAHDITLCDGDHFLQTHSTNPLLGAETLRAAIERYFRALEEGYDSLFSVTRLQTRLYDRFGAPVNHSPTELLRTQDLPPVFEENSCFYLFSRESFLAQRRRIGRRPLLHEIPREESWDIDEEIDFRVAEFLWRCKSGPAPGAAGKDDEL